MTWFPSSATMALGALLAAADAGAPASSSPAADAAAPRAAAPWLLVAPPRPAVPPPDADDYPLRPAKDGSGDLLYQSSGFRARVAPDGTVTFTNRHLSDVSVLPFLPTRMSFAVPSLQSSIGSLLRWRAPEAPPLPDDRLPPEETKQLIPNVSRYRPDTRDGCTNCVPRLDAMPANVTGRMDLTDELMRLAGQDPHRYQKARFLVATRELRIRMAVKTHAANIRRATAELPSLLDGIACDDRLSRRDQRAILEALRDEMDTTPPGRAAAETIARFIATRFAAPDGGVAPACPPRSGGGARRER